MSLDAKYVGDWTVTDFKKTASFAKGDIFTVSDSNIVSKITHVTPATMLREKFNAITLQADGTTEVTTPTGTIVFFDDKAEYTTGTFQLELKKGTAPGPGTGTGSEKSGDTGMALILGLVLVGLFAFNDIF
jgi:hypothetical protein